MTKKLFGLAFLLLSITAAASASAQSFGEIFPVTNTRYGTASGTPRLAANGRDFFLAIPASTRLVCRLPRGRR